MSNQDFDPVVRARRYLELSNAHQLEEIFEMFREDASYVSSGVGKHEGLPAIEMMRAFFGRYPTVWWEVEEYRLMQDGAVELDFVRHFCGDDGEPKTQTGWERIGFDDRGRIRRIETRAS